MDTEQVNDEIDEIERALRAGDPELDKRLRRLQRREAVHVVSVFALLAVGAVLLVVGLAILSPVAWCVGVAAYLAAFVVDRHFEVA